MSVFMQPIYTQTASGSSTTFQFNNIPQGFTDLKIVVSGRTQSASNFDSFWMRTGNGAPNGGSVYSNLRMVGTGTSNFSDFQTSDQSPFIAITANVATSTYLAGTFSSYEIYIPNYSRGAIKSALIQNAVENNNTGTNVYLMQYAQTIYDTSPINTVQIATASGSNWTAGTTVTLYGISNVFDTGAPIAPTLGTITDQAGFFSVAFTPTANDRADTYYAYSPASPTSPVYGNSSPIAIPVTSQYNYNASIWVAAVNSLGVAPSTNSPGNVTSNDYASIATTSLTSGSATTITFNAIPQNYQHLQIRFIARLTGANDQIRAQFNDVSSAIYGEHELTGNGGGAYAASSINSTSIPIIGFATGSGAAANLFGVGIIDILDYSNTSKFKTTRTLTGYDANGGGLVSMLSGCSQSFAPISSISFISSATAFAQFSHVALYGIG